jgi:hypothetical protein
MRTISSRKIRQVLRENFNLRPHSRGNGTGHDVWIDLNGRTCKPLLRKKSVSVADLFSLGLEMESKGITNRRMFMRAVLG